MTKTLNEQQPTNPTYLDGEMTTRIGELFGKVLTLVSSAKKETSSLVNAKNIEIDEEDLETMKDQLAKLTKPATYVMEISGQLCQGFKTQVAQVVRENFLNYFAMSLQSYKTLSESELLDATCFFCDFIEHSFHSDTGMIAELTNKFLEIFNWTGATTDVKQTLTYGMGVFSMFVPKGTFPTAAVFQALNSMVSAPDAFSEENAVATESALGAVGKLVYFQKDGAVVIDAVTIGFLSKLPFKFEETEAQTTHQLFLEQVIANNNNLITDATKDSVLAAVNRLRTEKVEIEFLNEESKSLLAKLA